MIKLRSRINILNSNTKLNNIIANFQNTENSAPIKNVLNQKNAEVAYIGSQASGINGFFYTPYEFVLENYNLSGLAINFDYINGVFPTSLSLYTIEDINVETQIGGDGNFSYESNGSSTSLKLQGNYNDYGLDISEYLLKLRKFLDNAIPSGTIITDYPDGYKISNGFVDFIVENMGIIIDFNIKTNESDNTIDITLNLSTPLAETSGVRSLTATISKSTTSTTTKKELIGKYTDNDALYVINDIDILPTQKLQIEISQINKPFTNLTIYGITTNLLIDVDRHNIVNIDCSNFDRSDVRYANFGIISNVGNIEFRDIDNEVLNYAEEGLLKKGLDCKIELVNTLNKKTKLISSYLTSQWNYDNDSKTVSVSLKDDLEEWQDINIKGFSYDPRDLTPKNLQNYYVYLYNLTPKKYNMLAFDELDENTKTVLEKTYIKYPMLKDATLWQEWTKLCLVCQAHIYKGIIDNEVRTIFRYNEGN